MDPVGFLRLVVLAVAAAFAVGLWRRIAVYRRGRARKVAVLAGLATVPRRYLVDLHHKVQRDTYASAMHVCVAGGFVASGLIFLLTLVLPGAGFFDVLGLACAAVMLAGAGMAVWRRTGRRGGYPAARSGGEWRRLGASALLGAAGLVLWFASGGESWLASIAIALALLDLVAGAPWRTPMRHAVVGALNLAFHPRPDRFSDGRGRDTGLRPLDLGARSLGIVTADDMDWTRRLNVDACVQCGRCEAACPAFAAGQPLNPKALVQDLVRASGLADMAGTYAGHGHLHLPIVTGAGEARILPDLVDAGTLWSCTTCRACVEECPMMIEHVDAVVDLRRARVLHEGALPGAGAAVLANYDAADTPGGRDPARRFDWAAGLGLPILPEGGAAEVLLWAGEAAFEARGQRTLRALVALLRQAGITPAILGDAERDTGDLARRMGDEATFQRLARRNIATLDRRRIGVILTTDPHALHALTAEYPAFGAVPPARHHTQLLADLLEAGRLAAPARLASRVTYHDPCYLGRYAGEYDAPRRILSRIAAEVFEMERSRHRARCCGGGGGAPVIDIPGERRIPDMRMADVAETGAALVAVACPNCAVMLEGVGGKTAGVADIAELLAHALGLEP